MKVEGVHEGVVGHWQRRNSLILEFLIGTDRDIREEEVITHH